MCIIYFLGPFSIAICIEQPLLYQGDITRLSISPTEIRGSHGSDREGATVRNREIIWSMINVKNGDLLGFNGI